MSQEYKIPPSLRDSIIRSWLFLRPRNFNDDARACLASLELAPHYSGLEYIPNAGPYLVTFNHYYRTGSNVMWLWVAMALAAVLPREAGAVMTGELTFPGRWYAVLGKPLSRVVLNRLARLYGFINMPPMPPREQDAAARAASVRAVLTWLERTPDPVLMLAPEGGDQPGGRLALPPPGLGRFIALIAARGLPILPAAGWEADDHLCVRFGPPYGLDVSGGQGGRNQLDLAAGTQVMHAIAGLLPRHLRGDFDR